MALQLTQPSVLAALIALVGVVFSIALSLIVSRRQTQIEREKLNRTLEAAYEQKLVEMRLSAHQALWRALTKLNKGSLQSAFEDRRVNILLSETLSELNAWYENNGIALSKNSYGGF